jgi:hypothetical protein
MSALVDCPCCKQRTLTERGHYDICGICGWEDDPLQADDPDYTGGANGPSLNEARLRFARGAETRSESRLWYGFAGREPSRR